MFAAVTAVTHERTMCPPHTISRNHVDRSPLPPEPRRHNR